MPCAKVLRSKRQKNQDAILISFLVIISTKYKKYDFGKNAFRVLLSFYSYSIIVSMHLRLLCNTGNIQ